MKQSFGDRLIREYPVWFWPVVGLLLAALACAADAYGQNPCPILDTTCGTTSGGQKLK